MAKKSHYGKKTKLTKEPRTPHIVTITSADASDGALPISYSFEKRREPWGKTTKKPEHLSDRFKIKLLDEFLSSAKIIEEMAIVDGNWLRYVDNQTEDMCRAAICQCPEMIKYAKYQPEDACMLAIQINPKLIKWAMNPTFEMYKIAVSQCGKMIKHVTDDFSDDFMYSLGSSNVEITSEQYAELCELAVTQDPMSVLYMTEPSDKLIKKAILQDGDLLAYIKTNDCDLVKEAIALHPLAIRFVEQTPELCTIAVTKNYHVLEYVKCKTTEILEAAKLAERSEKEKNVIDPVSETSEK